MADTGLGAAIENLITEAVNKAVQKNEAGTQQPVQSGQTSQQLPQTATAAPTNVSDISAPVAKTGNMLTGEYVSPYQAEQQQLSKDLGDAKLYETPQATKDYMAAMFEQQTKPYEYDVENDPMVAAARKNVEKSVMDMASKRGFAYGSYESDQVRQQMEKLNPQFEQMAYDQNSDYLNRQLGLANTIMNWEKIQFDRSKNAIELLRTKLDFINKLDDRQFDIFKVMLDNRNTQRSIFMQSQRLDMQRKSQEFTKAINRIENLGYIDNQASLILGLPVGTKAKWAQQAAVEQQNKLELMARENEYNIIKQKLDADIEKELYALKTSLDEGSKMKYLAMEYQYKKELQAMEFEYNKQMKAIEEAKAAAAEAASRARSGSSSSAKYNSKLDTEFKSESRTFLNKFGIKKSYGQDAADYIDALRRIGVSEEVLLRMKDEFNIPEKKSTVFKGIDWSTGKPL